MDRIYAHGRAPAASPDHDLPGDPEAYRAWIQQTTTDESASACLARAAAELDLGGARIALDSELLSVKQIEQIRNDLPEATILSGDDLIRMIRMVKSPELSLTPDQRILAQTA